jgi:hypothetical protein
MCGSGVSGWYRRRKGPPPPPPPPGTGPEGQAVREKQEEVADMSEKLTSPTSEKSQPQSPKTERKGSEGGHSLVGNGPQSGKKKSKNRGERNKKKLPGRKMPGRSMTMRDLEQAYSEGGRHWTNVEEVWFAGCHCGS